jgi:hypothetical protein
MDVMMVVVTVVSLIIAVIMSIAASRMVREERRRSDARVAALASDIRAEDLPLQESARPTTERAALFATSPTLPARSGLAVAVVLGALAVGTAAALAIVFASAGTRPSVAVDAQPTARAQTDAAATGGPLELVALGHEREADGLTIRGVLRNPTSGPEIHELTAVVLLFNHAGAFVASGRAAVQATTLLPGGETTFVVSVPAASGADRYRVSFRTDDHVLPHVDVRS